MLKNYRFVCPKCGKETVIEENIEMLVCRTVQSVEPDEFPNYVEGKDIYLDGEHQRFQCAECGTTIGEQLAEDELYDFLETNNMLLKEEEKQKDTDYGKYSQMDEIKAERIADYSEKCWFLGTDVFSDDDLNLINELNGAIYTREEGAVYYVLFDDGYYRNYSDRFRELIKEAKKRGYVYLWFDRDIKTAIKVTTKSKQNETIK